MNRKWFRAAVFLLLFMALMPMQAFAMEEVTAELPFTIENASGTVVIEAVDGSPLPAQTKFADVTEGKFVLSYGEPGDYAYRVYQKPGTEPKVTYDETVYDVIVSVFVNEDDSLYTVVTLSVAGDSQKPDGIKFTNLLPPPEEDPPTTGDTSHLPLWIFLAGTSLAGLLILVFARRRVLDE